MEAPLCRSEIINQQAIETRSDLVLHLAEVGELNGNVVSDSVVETHICSDDTRGNRWLDMGAWLGEHSLDRNLIHTADFYGSGAIGIRYAGVWCCLHG